MKKFEVSVAVNRLSGYQVYGIEAKNKEKALQTFQNGEIIREEFEDIDWDPAYGEPDDPIIMETEKFEFGYEQRLEQKIKKLKAEIANLKHCNNCKLNTNGAKR